jgi:adenylate cyclase
MADEAMKCAERALALEPGQFEAELVRAMVYRIKGEHAALLKALERVLAMDPSHQEALEFMGWSYLALGRPSDAERILLHLISLAPESYRPYRWLEQAYDVLNRSEDSQRMLKTSREKVQEWLSRHPDDAYARSILATNLIQEGEKAAGMVQAELAVSMAPEDGRVRYNAACTYARAGEVEKAIAELKEGVRRVPTYIADWPRHDPDVDSLRHHPEFIRMVGPPTLPRPV